MLCNWTEPLVPSLLMALFKGVYPSRGSFLTVFLVTSTSLLPTQMCGFPWGCLRLLFLTLRCMRLFSLCVFFRVCFSWHLSLSLFSFFLFIEYGMYYFGTSYIWPFGISYMLLLLWRKPFWVSNTLLDIDAEMIEQLIWVKKQIFLEIFFPFIILKLKLLKLKCILKTLNISTWFLKDSCAE